MNIKIPLKAPLLVMLSLVVASFIIAILLHPGNREQDILSFIDLVGTKNKGTLLRPSTNLADYPIQTATGDTWEWGQSKDQGSLWHLAIPMYAGCNTHCKQQLHKSRQVRKRLNKYANQVQRLLLFEGAPDDELEQFLQQEHSEVQLLYWPRSGFNLAFEGTNSPTTAEGQLYIIDPRGVAMMFYTIDNSPADIFADLKFLISNSP